MNDEKPKIDYFKMDDRSFLGPISSTFIAVTLISAIKAGMIFHDFGYNRSCFGWSLFTLVMFYWSGFALVYRAHRRMLNPFLRSPFVATTNSIHWPSSCFRYIFGKYKFQSSVLKKPIRFGKSTHSLTKEPDSDK